MLLWSHGAPEIAMGSRQPDQVDEARPGSTLRISLERTLASRAIAADEEIQGLEEAELVDRIQRLRRDRSAVILAHNYQIPVIQDLARWAGTGQPLLLSRRQPDSLHRSRYPLPIRLASRARYGRRALRGRSPFKGDPIWPKSWRT
jgi:hypothetical protein